MIAQLVVMLNITACRNEIVVRDLGAGPQAYMCKNHITLTYQFIKTNIGGGVNHVGNRHTGLV